MSGLWNYWTGQQPQPQQQQQFQQPQQQFQQPQQQPISAGVYQGVVPIYYDQHSGSTYPEARESLEAQRYQLQQQQNQFRQRQALAQANNDPNAIMRTNNQLMRNQAAQNTNQSNQYSVWSNQDEYRGTPYTAPFTVSNRDAQQYNPDNLPRENQVHSRGNPYQNWQTSHWGGRRRTKGRTKRGKKSKRKTRRS